MSPATATLGATPKIAGEIFWGAAQQPRSPLPERVRVLPSPSSARGQRGQDGPGSTFGVPELNSPQSRAASRRGEARSLPPTSRSERRPRLQSRPEVVPVTPPARRGGWGGGRGRRHTWSGSRGTESRQEQAQHLHPHRLPGSPMALPPSRCRGRGPRAAAPLAPCPAEVCRKPARHPGAGCGGGSILPQQTAARPRAGGSGTPWEDDGGGPRSLGDLATCSQGPRHASGAAPGAAGPRGAAPHCARDPRGEGLTGATLQGSQPPLVPGSWDGQHGVSGVPPGSGSSLG